MSTMIVQVYDAFKSIGIDDAHARDAAIALSDNPKAISDLRGDMADEFAKVRSEMASEFTKVRSEMTGEFAKVRSDIAALRTEPVVVRVVLGGLYAFLIPIVFMLFKIAIKTGSFG